MMIEVLVNGWRVGRGKHRARYDKGDIVDADLVAATFHDGHARLDGYRRLGFFRIVEEPETYTDAAGLNIADTVVYAATVDDLEAFVAWEKSHKNRAGVLAALEDN